MGENNESKNLIKVVLEFSDDKIYAVGLEEGNTSLTKDFFKVKRAALTKRFRSLWNAKAQYRRRKVLPLESFSLVTVRCNDLVPVRQEENNSSEMNLSESSENNINLEEIEE
jgi:hypothetical protein